MTFLTSLNQERWSASHIVDDIFGFLAREFESASHIVGASDCSLRDSSLTSNTNSILYYIYAYDGIARTRASRLCRPPRGRTHLHHTFPHTLTNDSSFGDLLLLESLY